MDQLCCAFRTGTISTNSCQAATMSPPSRQPSRTGSCSRSSGITMIINNKFGSSNLESLIALALGHCMHQAPLPSSTTANWCAVDDSQKTRRASWVGRFRRRPAQARYWIFDCISRVDRAICGVSYCKEWFLRSSIEHTRFW